MISKYIKDNKGQVSFEYLLTVVFAILLVIAVTLFVLQLRNIGLSAKTKITQSKIEYFKKTFE